MRKEKTQIKLDNLVCCASLYTHYIQPKKDVRVSKKKAETKSPNLAVEAALSAFRWFLIFIILNNAIWVGVQLSSGKTNIKMIQDGTGNTSYTQSISTPDTNK